MDSLMSLSDCDLDCPENKTSSNPLTRIRNFTPAVRQPRSLTLHRHSMPAIALTSHEQKTASEKTEDPTREFQRPDEVTGNAFLETSFEQLNFLREKQSPPTSNVTSPALSSVSSMECAFSPLHSPARSQSDWLVPNGADYQKSISLQSEKLHPANHQTNKSRNLLSKLTKNPPSYEQALQQLNRKAILQTQTPQNGKGLFYKGPVGPLGDHQVSPAPIRFTCQTDTEEETKLPQSVFYGQSCKLTMHREQNADLKSSKHSGQQLRCKALDLHPSSGKIVGDFFMDASPVAEKQTIGRGRRLSCCSSSQWVV